jgi:hypothetical protein
MAGAAGRRFRSRPDVAPERKADVIEVVKLMEAQDKSGLRLADELEAEVERRLAEDNPNTITLAEFNARLRRRYGI